MCLGVETPCGQHPGRAGHPAGRWPRVPCSTGTGHSRLSATCQYPLTWLLSPPGTHEGVAKPSLAATRPPRARDQERKKGSFTSSLRMEPHSHPGKSRKPTRFRALSRSLMLCNAKTSDDGSSPDEKYPDPFEMSLGQGKEGLLHSSVQLADTSEARPGSIPDLAPSSEATPVPAAGSDRGKGCRRAFFTKVRRSLGARGACGRFLLLRA